MTIFHALVLGFVQGMTEFLPVSSSGHLVLVPALFGWPVQPVAFDAALHLGTLLAVFIALREDIMRILRGLFKKGDEWGQLGWMIAAASIPVLLVAFLMNVVFTIDARSPLVIAGTLAFWGVALYFVDRYVPTKESLIQHTGWKRALIIGCAQVLSLIPGTSRSGVTITAGRALGLSRETAAKFSFLLGIPAILAAGSFAVLQILQGAAPVPVIPLLVGFMTAFVSGLFAIQWLLKLMKSTSYAPFAIYRVALAVMVWILLVGG